MGSPADESDGAKRKVARLANVCGNGASDRGILSAIALLTTLTLYVKCQVIRRAGDRLIRSKPERRFLPVRSFSYWIVVVCLSFAAAGHAQIDSTPHKILFISVDKDVELEVLDWGGSGPPLILLPGLGDTAHVFDNFALKLTPSYHVFGITPRGFGASSAPSPEGANYSADRMGDDVVSVIDSLKLNRAVLAGHSVAGEVLSAVANRHPDRVSALIYIDAGYAYALYDKAHGDLVLDCITLRNKLKEFHLGTLPRNPEQVDELLSDVHQIERELQQRRKDLSQVSPPHSIDNPISVALLDGQQKFTEITPPVLAIFNVPHSPAFRRTMEDQANAFEIQVPHARIVRIANAEHYLFQSKADEVVSEINTFIARSQHSQ
jgi:non-heme chloroperoxidase